MSAFPPIPRQQLIQHFRCDPEIRRFQPCQREDEIGQAPARGEVEYTEITDRAETAGKRRRDAFAVVHQQKTCLQ